MTLESTRSTYPTDADSLSFLGEANAFLISTRKTVLSKVGKWMSNDL
mgnify:CR=1 FL=1